MTNSFELKTPEGEIIEIEVEEFTTLEQVKWGGRVPDGLKNVESPENARVTPESVQFLVDLTTSQTVLTESLLNELDMDELGHVFNATVGYAFGGDDFEVERPEEPEGIEFDDDDGFDLGDWR